MLLILLVLLVPSTKAFASFKCADVDEAVNVFVNTHVKVSKCDWDSQFVKLSLGVGLGRICEINPGLVNGILGMKLNTPLNVICDVIEGQRSPYFSYAESTIHVWSSSSAAIRTQATIFHEFLHFLDIPIDEDAHNDPSSPLPELDPVYACHVTGYPEEAERILGDVERYPQAVRTCSNTLSFCDPEFPDTICWNVSYGTAKL
jgi:hypothetical protein